MDSFSAAPHNLEWLEIEERIVSGNRGVATRIKKGVFANDSQKTSINSLKITLHWDESEVDLVIDENGCRIFSKKY